MSTATAKATGFLPLSGVRVLDLTTTLLGPLATQILGDFGADVIKVEAPGGDPMRHVGATRHRGMASVYLGVNRNKRSIVLDLKGTPAKEVLWRLIDSAQMLIHNMRPQKIVALGFGPDTVLERNPQLVYGGLHGYWEQGPYGSRPAYDDVIQGECGLAGAFFQRDGEPTLIPSAVVDKSVAWMAASGLLAAYVRRLRFHRGAYLEVGMFEGMVGYNMVEHQYGATFSPPAGKPGYPRSLSTHRRPHRTLDGYLCMLPMTDRQWQSFWHLASQPELAEDPRFCDIGARTENADALYAAAGEVLARRTTNTWLEVLGKAQIPAGPVRTLEELAQDPHLRQVGFFRKFHHPTEEALEVPDTPFRLDREALPVRTPHPRLGEHGAEILQELGYEPSAIRDLL